MQLYCLFYILCSVHEFNPCICSVGGQTQLLLGTFLDIRVMLKIHCRKNKQPLKSLVYIPHNRALKLDLGVTAVAWIGMDRTDELFSAARVFQPASAAGHPSPRVLSSLTLGCKRVLADIKINDDILLKINKL